MFLPTKEDVESVTSSLLVIVSRILIEYISDLSPLCKAVTKHIPHKYPLCKAVTKHIPHKYSPQMLYEVVSYLGDGYPHEKRVASGGDQLTTERQNRHLMCGNRPQDCLYVLEPLALSCCPSHGMYVH